MTNPITQSIQRAAAHLFSMGRSGPRGLGLMALALAIPLGAVTAAGALAESGPLAAPAALVTAMAEEMGLATDTPTTSVMVVGEATVGNPPVLGTASPDVSPIASFVRAALEVEGDTPTASPEATGTAASGTPAAAAATAHTNGHGCDDIIHGEDGTPGPGGPVGCQVGNSGDHRQNGKKLADAAATATETATSTPTPDATPTSAAEKKDPHDDGHGCDDIIHAEDRTKGTPGGPIGCEVGNSADHRQNGLHGAHASTPEPETTPGATPTSATPETSSATAGSTGPGASGGHGAGGTANGHAGGVGKTK